MVDDGRTTEHGYTISSPCEPDGSGELKNCLINEETKFDYCCSITYLNGKIFYLSTV